MYYRGRVEEEKEIPFDIVCTNCGSHNVTVTAFEYFDLEIKCNNCGSYLGDYGRYNPTAYEG